MIPPAYVKPFVKRQKNDAADTEAIVEAHLAEHGIIATQGIANLTLLAEIVEDHDTGLDLIVVETARLYLDQIDALSSWIASLEKALRSEAKRSQRIARLMSMPRHGTDYRNGGRGLRLHHGYIPKGARFCGLARLGAKTAFERWKAGARPNVEDGAARHSTASDHRCDDCDPVGMPESPARELAVSTDVGAQASHARCDRSRQQNGSVDLGDDDEE